MAWPRRACDHMRNVSGRPGVRRGEVVLAPFVSHDVPGLSFPLVSMAFNAAAVAVVACLAQPSLAVVGQRPRGIFADDDAMQLHLLVPGEGGNACLDGSPFGYYIAANSSSSDWVIDIDGGGWCDSAAACATRISRLASSTTWGRVASGSGITSGSARDNPDYHTYNRVNFPYCDGSSFTSHRERPLRVQTGNTTRLLHMRGWDNLHAAVASLKRDFGMRHVRRLVVTGGSAGGTSTFLHTDHLARLTSAEFAVGLPDAGAFRVMAPPACCAWQDIVTLHSECTAIHLLFLSLPSLRPQSYMLVTSV